MVGAAGGVDLLDAGTGSAPPAAEGLRRGGTTASCVATLGTDDVPDEVLACVSVAGGLVLGAGIFWEAAEVAPAEGGSGSGGKTTELTIEGSSWSFT